MKHVFTVSLDLETVAKIREASRLGKFRNKSHFVEEAINEFLSKQNIDSSNNSLNTSSASKEVKG